MTIFVFQTIARPGKGLYKEKNSRFLSYAIPVGSEDEVKQHLERLRKEYFDARHHCYAWVLGPDKARFRAFDDGEPNHSAGNPILGQIRSRNLTNVLVVVVRYFGGTKLGVGGLISAYRTAADLALEDAGIVETIVTEQLSITFTYDDIHTVMRMIRDGGLQVVSQDFGETCGMKLRIPRKDLERLRHDLDVLIATGSGIRYTVES